MRVSKLEPHILGGPPADNLDNVVDAMVEEVSDVSDVETTTQEDTIDSSASHDQSLKDTLVRLADYVKNRRGRDKSRKTIAIWRYIWQRDLLVNAQRKKSLKI